MDYQAMLDELEQLDFIRDNETADAALKACLGILASRLPEDQARELTSKLPEPLTYEKLRSHQKFQIVAVSMDEYIGELSHQFNWGNEQSERLVQTVFHLIKGTVGADTLKDVERYLSEDWTNQLEAA